MIRSLGAEIDDSPHQRRLRTGRQKKHGRHKAESVFARSLAWSLLIDSVHANLLNDTANIWGGGQTIVSF